MRHRPLVALALALSAGACQLLWSYDGFKDAPGGSGGGHAASSTSMSSSGSSGASRAASSGSSSSSSSGDAACVPGGPDAGDAGDAGDSDAGACNNGCDRLAMQANRCNLQSDVFVGGLCYGDPPSCLVRVDDLSPACAVCWVQLENCGGSRCDYLNGPCWNNANAAGCNACLDTHCEEAFRACSGVDRPGASLDGGDDAGEGGCK